MKNIFRSLILQETIKIIIVSGSPRLYSLTSLILYNKQKYKNQLDQGRLKLFFNYKKLSTLIQSTQYNIILHIRDGINM